MPERDPACPVLIRRSTIESMEQTKFVHPLNAQAIRWTRSLGDACGLTSLGVHLVRVKPGRSQHGVSLSPSRRRMDLRAFRSCKGADR